MRRPRRRARGLLVAILTAVVLAVVAVVVLRVSPETSDLLGPDRRLARAVDLRPVLAESPGACPRATPDRLPAAGEDGCLTLAPDGLRLTRVRSATVLQPPGEVGWVVRLQLRSPDADALRRLSGGLVHRPVPRNWLAFVLDGPPTDQVLEAPEVEAPITGGRLDLATSSRESAEALRAEITG